MDIVFFSQLLLWAFWASLLSVFVLGLAEYAAGKIRRHSSFIVWSHIANRLFHTYTHYLSPQHPLRSFMLVNVPRNKLRISILHGALYGIHYLFLGMLLTLVSGVIPLNSFTGNTIIYFILLFLEGMGVLYLLGLSPLPWKWNTSYLLKEMATKFIYAVALAFLFTFIIFPLLLT